MQGLKERSSKRKLQEGILYLSIVNMPSEQELAEAKAKLQQKQGKKTDSGSLPYGLNVFDASST